MTIAKTLLAKDRFVHRHLGPRSKDIQEMLSAVGMKDYEELLYQCIPDSIRAKEEMRLDGLQEALSEMDVIARLKKYAEENVVHTSLIGAGYYDCVTPPVIQRNVLENPGWYTQYTPYQAEISQGRLEALINFQTMVGDLCGLPLANASLLDEATAVAEGMSMCAGILGKKRGERDVFVVAADCHPQSIKVTRSRAEPLGFTVQVVSPDELVTFDYSSVFGVALQYPATDGVVRDYREVIAQVHEQGALVVAAVDLLALTLLESPGVLGADIAVGSSQRFGVPLGFGGPHAGFLATKEEYKRHVPGRLIGVSKDQDGRVAYRLALQTREQHIRRDRATSNICTAQVLLAIMASMYAVYHGPDGLTEIAKRVRGWTRVVAHVLAKGGIELVHNGFFDTLRFRAPAGIHEKFNSAGFNVREYENGDVGVSFDETTNQQIVTSFLEVLGLGLEAGDLEEAVVDVSDILPRTTEFLTHPIFHSVRSEHDMLRYLYKLQQKDLSLTTSMIPLGSCTMKLNATAEMIPVTFPGFSRVHPMAPEEQTRGYQKLIGELSAWLAELTGFAAISMQPNSGAQGEFAGLLSIRDYHLAQKEPGRTVCLVPTSAHGTNPASAVLAGFRVVPVACDENGNVKISDVREKAQKYSTELGAIMITYPSTHGVFESTITEICDVVHEHGGLVYLDGANMNAQVGVCRPGDYGADVCHLNLHKTFCIPHGGGGPGMGPIGVVERLVPHLPSSPYTEEGYSVAAAPYGSASILPISYAYLAMMGIDGLKEATSVAILNANYMAKKLEGHYDVVYRGENGYVAHEFILDCRGFKKTAGITVEDIAKRLMDYGFHAPTMSWPVAGTLMVEPTESESKEELDRFCKAMIEIRKEITNVENGEWPKDNNPLVNAPHTMDVLADESWGRPYSREVAVFPVPWLRGHKYWPSVSRVDNAFGDRNLVCSCPPMEAYAE